MLTTTRTVTHDRHNLALQAHDTRLKTQPRSHIIPQTSLLRPSQPLSLTRHPSNKPQTVSAISTPLIHHPYTPHTRVHPTTQQVWASLPPAPPPPHPRTPRRGAPRPTPASSPSTDPHAALNAPRRATPRRASTANARSRPAPSPPHARSSLACSDLGDSVTRISDARVSSLAVRALVRP